jgi:hypothetical protein
LGKLKHSFMPTLKSLERVFTGMSRVCLLSSLLSLMLAEPGEVRASPVVACTEEDLRIALSEGGTVTFGCSGTITVTNTIVISTNVVLDGTGQTTSLSGGNAVRIFRVNPGFTLSIRNLTLTSGADTGTSGTNGTAGASASGGVIYNDGGTVSLVNCQVSGNKAAAGNGGDGVVQLNGNGGSGGSGGSASGGAIFNNGGTVLLTNCVFSGNTASGGNGGNGADGVVSGNGRSGGNGGNGGGASGGAIFNTGGGTVVSYDCMISSNSVAGASSGLGGVGNGLGADGANGAPGDSLSGGICNESGTITILFSTFNGNTATGGQGGGALAGAFSGTGGTGTAGGVASGGGIFNQSGALAMTNATFYANSVIGGKGGNGGDGGKQGFGGSGGNGGAGGSGIGGGVGNAAGGTVTAVNCTFSKNIASGGGGGTGGASGGVGGNPGQAGASGKSNGGGIANDGGPLTFTLMNSIVAYSSSGGEGSGVITDGGNNISFNGSGASIAFTAPTSFASTNPYLGSLANNGGPTLTTAIINTKSVAINAGNDAVCPTTDQRHMARFGRCDIGAFEFEYASLAIELQTNQVVLTWTTALTGYSLQSTPSLLPTSWTTVTNPAVAVGANYVVTNNVDESSRFYRLNR